MCSKCIPVSLQYSHTYMYVNMLMTNIMYCLDAASGCVVNLYDSVYTGRLTPSLEKQIAEIYRPVVKDGMLPVTMVSFQQQVGDTDCGVYSIAAAYSAALGIEPHLMTFDADEMRGHLEQCFEDEKLTPFPLQRSLLRNVGRSMHSFMFTAYVDSLKVMTLT